MKKLFNLLAGMFFSLSAMDEPPKTSSEHQISDLCGQLSRTCPELRNKIALLGAKKHWWYPASSKSIKEFAIQSSGALFQFSPSGNKLVLSCNSGTLQVYNGELERTQFLKTLPDMQIESMIFDKEEKKVFGFGSFGRRFCFDIYQKKMLYEKDFFDISDCEFQFNKSMTKVILGNKKQAQLVDADTGKVECSLWKDMHEHIVYCGGFLGDSDFVGIFCNQNCRYSSSFERLKIFSILPNNAT